MTLFASVAGGAPASGFRQRLPTYNNIQGKLETLLILVNARGTPSPPAAGVAIFGAFGVQNAQQRATEIMEPSTPKNIKSMIVIINQMKNDDVKGRLSADNVLLMKNNFGGEMSLALTYEKTLDR